MGGGLKRKGPEGWDDGPENGNGCHKNNSQQHVNQEYTQVALRSTLNSTRSPTTLVDEIAKKDSFAVPSMFLQRVPRII